MLALFSVGSDRFLAGGLYRGDGRRRVHAWLILNLWALEPAALRGFRSPAAYG